MSPGGRGARGAWTPADSERLYGVAEWGEGYFEVNARGNLAVNPGRGPDGPRIDMADVIREIKGRGLRFPVVVRFHDILWSRVETLNRTFREAIRAEGYRGGYRGVYPIKVNQMREVVEEIVEAGAPWDFGLEAGSRTELEAVLALNTNEGSLTILNGHKDDECLRLALLGRRLGWNVVVVIEKLSELGRLVRIGREMGVEPLVGIRAALAAESSGRWRDSSGGRAKFGLTVPEILSAVGLLGREGLLPAFRLLHFHIGSQVSDIKCFRDAVVEATRIYAKLHKSGARLEYIDVGGGLGIDYDGSRSAGHSSRNYTLAEYVSNVVWGIKDICDQEGVPHPHIVSESGRAVTAQHSCVVSNVVDVIESRHEDADIAEEEGEHNLVRVARENLESLGTDNVQEVYNDNLAVRRDAVSAFNLGILSLGEYSKIESIVWKVNKGVLDLIGETGAAPDYLQDLEERMASKYLYNLSVFQSAADHWAVGQVLPVVPITRLDEKPTKRCTLVDITCDSDGRLKRFIDSGEVRGTLPLHEIRPGEEYYVGLFLTGAYQDVMGDMHNLFGRLGEIHVFSYDDDTGFYFEEVVKGASSGQVLSDMQYSPGQMAHTIKKRVDRMIKRGDIGPKEGVGLAALYERGLQGYTYLHRGDGPAGDAPAGGP